MKIGVAGGEGMSRSNWFWSGVRGRGKGNGERGKKGGSKTTEAKKEGGGVVGPSEKGEKRVSFPDRAAK